jgi:hypothetical protein
MLINESLNSIIMITHIHIFLAYFPERKVGLTNQQSTRALARVCLCARAPARPPARVYVCPRSLRSSKNDQKALLA